jgi:hypothetical protein
MNQIEDTPSASQFEKAKAWQFIGFVKLDKLFTLNSRTEKSDALLTDDKVKFDSVGTTLFAFSCGLIWHETGGVETL